MKAICQWVIRAMHSKPLKGAVLLGLFLLLLAMAHSWALHACVHPEADHADHHCAVTMLQQGQVDTTTVAVAVVVVPPMPVADVVTPATFFPIVDFFLPPGRGPPALFA